QAEARGVRTSGVADGPLGPGARGRASLVVGGRRFGDEFLLRYLADQGLRQLLAELDQPRHLERRELVAQELAQFTRRQGGPLTLLDEGLDDFPAMRVRNAA